MTGDDDPQPDSGIEPPARGFQVESPEIEIMPGQEITYCYYFRTPNTEPMAIKKWVSEMTPGSHHMIMFTTANTQGQPVDSMPPGTVSASNCGFGGGGQVIPSWIYAAQTPTSELDLPADDGAGKPVAMEIAANSAAFFQMHYLNATDAPLKAKVTLNAEALDAGVEFTRTAAYITYNNSISIPPETEGHVETQSCSVPAGKKFWLMSTHAHKQAIKTEVKDGSTMAFQSTDWEHPGAEMWMANPFFTFGSNQITYSCTYDNSSSREINSGDSAATDEMCMATGYFFPATKPLICFDGLGPF
jgi:hypothetical protein